MLIESAGKDSVRILEFVMETGRPPRVDIQLFFITGSRDIPPALSRQTLIDGQGLDALRGRQYLYTRARRL